MENDFDSEDGRDFRINPQVWLHTLLAIAGDKEKREEVVQRVAQATGYPPEKIEVVMAAAINILMNQAHSN